MTEVPDEAVQAAWRYVTLQTVLWQYIDQEDVRELLMAAAPLLAAQVRRETAQQIAAALSEKATRCLHEAKEFSTAKELAKSLITRAGALSAAAEIADQIGEADAR